MSADSQSGSWDVVSDEPAPARSSAQQGTQQSGWDVASDEADKPPAPPEQSVTDFLLNQAPHSIYRTAQNLTHAVIHPIDTAWDAGKLVAGTFRAAARGAGMEMDDNEADQVARAFWEYGKSRWGSVDAIKNALYHDPVGMLMDFSTVMTGAGGLARGAGLVADVARAARTAETVGALGRGLTTAGKVTNPLYLPSKAVSGTLGAFMPKKTPPAPEDVPLSAFDPKAGKFEGPPVAGPVEGPTVAFDPKTGRFSNEPPVESMDPVQQLREKWGIKNPPSGRTAPGKPQPAAQPAPPAPPAAVPTGPAQQVWGMIKQAGVGGVAGHLLTHTLMGGAYGMLTGAALKALPVFLKSSAGQQMLARIGPGSNAAAVASVARDMVPALNAFGASMSQPSVFDARAKGGMVNPELARIQRERLRLPGILEMLGNVK